MDARTSSAVAKPPRWPQGVRRVRCRAEGPRPLGCPKASAAKIVAGQRVPHAGGLLAASGRLTGVSVREQLPVDLYDSEKERRADAEQQRAVHRFQGAQHMEPGRQR